MKGRYVVFIIVLSAVLGCERDFAVTLPSHEPKLVVHGYIETGQPFMIAVGRTFKSDVLISNDDWSIGNALALLYEDNRLIDTLKYDSTILRYISLDDTAVVGKTYRIQVSAPGFQTVESSAKAFASVPTTHVQLVRNARVSSIGYSLSDVIFRFNDPPGEENYYLLQIGRSEPFRTFFCTYSHDAVIENYQMGIDPFEGSSCIWSDEILFSDFLFNGGSRQIIVSGDAEGLEEVDIAGVIYKPVMTRYSISKEFYQYLKSEISLDLLSSDPFSYPISIKGNIQNGYGMFTVFSGVTDTLQ